MEKLNNILNREDYIRSVNEGKIGDFLRKGVQKIKKAFGIFTAKIKDFIAVFTSDGELLPITTPQAIGDHFKGNKSVHFYSTPAMNKDIKNMGGTGCDTTTPVIRESDYVDDIPSGAFEYVKWMDSKYKETNYYKNLKTLGEMVESGKIPESYFMLEDGDLIEEFNYGKGSDFRRVPYNSKGGKNSLPTGTEKVNSITTDQFYEKLVERIEGMCAVPEMKTDEDELKGGFPPLLIFGPQGIGKSTIPKKVVEAFNDQKEPKDMISLITVSCGEIQPGDLLMPAMPSRKDILSWVDKTDGTLAAEKLADMTDKEFTEFKRELAKNPQYEAKSAPQPWLPCYKIQGCPADFFNDAKANGYITNVKRKVRDEESGLTFTFNEGVKAKSGGIILFDELLRANPSIFRALMNFLIDRELNGHRLGSKWVIIACSNRPCDDEDSFETWERLGSPARERFVESYNLIPDPDEWKAWARKIGFDETLLKFIFDESEKEGGEYTRWHRVADRESAKGDSHKPVSPRQWEWIHKALVRFAIKPENKKRFKDGFSISKMTVQEIEDVVSGYLDSDFLAELKLWFKENCSGLDLDKIIKDPVGTPMPIGELTNEKGEKLPVDEVTVINQLRNKMEERWGGKDPKSDVTDEELTSVMIWLGINYKNNFNVIYSKFAEQFKYIISKYGFWDFHKFGLMFMAAFPEEDYMDVVNHEKLREVLCDEKHGNGRTDFVLEKPEDLLDTVKDFAKEYFPWRLKDGELEPVLRFNSTSEDDVDSAKDTEDETPEA